MGRAKELWAIEQIKQLKARYFRFMDMKDWDNLPTLFTADVEADYRLAMLDPGDGEPDMASLAEHQLSGRDAVCAYIRTGLTPITSVHKGYMPEIEITGKHTARGIWPMTDELHMKEGPLSFIRGQGHYHETYRLEDDQWRIATIRLTRLKLEQTPA